MDNYWRGLEPLEPRMMLSAGPFHYVDADGDRYAVALRGPGTMQVVQHDPDLDGRGPIESIDLIGTTDKSRLVIRGQTTAGSITGDALAKLIAGRVTLNGAGVNLTGQANMVRLSALTDGANLILGGASDSASRVVIKTIDGGSEIDSGSALAHFVSVNVAPGVAISAPSAGKVRIKDTFSGSLTLDDPGTLFSLGTFMAGQLVGAEIRTTNNIATVWTRRAIDSTVFAGIDAVQAGLPDSPDDFVNKDAGIGSIVIRGKRRDPVWIANSHFAAWTIGRFRGGSAEPANGGVAFGLAANHVERFAYNNDDVCVKLRNAESTGVQFRDGDMTVRFFE